MDLLSELGQLLGKDGWLAIVRAQLTKKPRAVSGAATELCADHFADFVASGDRESSINWLHTTVAEGKLAELSLCLFFFIAMPKSGGWGAHATVYCPFCWIPSLSCL